MTIPPAFQCTAEDSIDHGAVAVRIPDDSPLKLMGDYGVMTTNRGGDYRPAAKIEGAEGWTPLAPTEPE